MSYTIVLQVQVELAAATPEWVLDYLAGISGPDRATARAHPPADTPVQGGIDADLWADGLPPGEWFVGVPCGLGRSPGGQRLFWMAGSFHDDFVQHEDLLLQLLGRNASSPQVIAARWSDMEEAQAEVWAVHAGELFRSVSGRWRHVGLPEDEPAGPPVEFLRDGSPDAQRRAMGHHGAGDAALAHHDAVAGPGEPTYARYLLARTLARALAAHGASAALPDVLAVLDRGADELGDPTTPGWSVVETWEEHRGRAETSRRLGGGLVAAGATLGGSELSAHPVRLVLGTRLRARRPVDLRRRGVATTVETGAEVVAVEAFDRGHVNVALAGTTDGLGFVRPEAVGTDWDVVDADPGAGPA